MARRYKSNPGALPILLGAAAVGAAYLFLTKKSLSDVLPVGGDLAEAKVEAAPILQAVSGDLSGVLLAGRGLALRMAWDQKGVLQAIVVDTYDNPASGLKASDDNDVWLAREYIRTKYPPERMASMKVSRPGKPFVLYDVIKGRAGQTS